LVLDSHVVAQTREDARELISNDIELTAHPALANEVRRRYGEGRLDELETS
jgi:hypothetical protein